MARSFGTPPINRSSGLKIFELDQTLTTEIIIFSSIYLKRPPAPSDVVSTSKLSLIIVISRDLSWSLQTFSKFSINLFADVKPFGNGKGLMFNECQFMIWINFYQLFQLQELQFCDFLNFPCSISFIKSF